MAPSAPGPLPPFHTIADFLDPSLHGELLDHVLSNAASFKPVGVHVDGVTNVDEGKRKGLHWGDFGPLTGRVETAFRNALPALSNALGVKVPADYDLEQQMTASGDGAFFRRHYDIPVGPGRQPLSYFSGKDRLLSAVYYFHRRPKGFSGGELRFHPWGAGDEDEHGVDLSPTDNQLVAFPSWANHEVRPVSCPSGAFADYRFGINCWYCAPLAR